MHEKGVALIYEDLTAGLSLQELSQHTYTNFTL